jgi:tetratricopeptide (TPR) repeat protein
MATSLNPDHNWFYGLMIGNIPSDPQAQKLHKKAVEIIKNGDKKAALKKLKECWQVTKTSIDQLCVAKIISLLSYKEDMGDTFQWMRLTENLFMEQTNPDLAQLAIFLLFYGQALVDWDGNPEEALRVLYKSRRFLASIKDQDEQNRYLLSNHGKTALTYQKLNQEHLVIHHLTKSLSYHPINVTNLDLLSVHNRLGESYMYLGHYEQAFDCFKTGHNMETFLNNNGKENVLNEFYEKIGNALMKLGKYRQAYKYLGATFKSSKKMIKDHDRPKDYHVNPKLYASVAYCQMHCGMYEIAEKNFVKALKHDVDDDVEEDDRRGHDDIMDAIVHCRKKRGDFQYVFSHQEMLYNNRYKKNYLVDLGEKTIRLISAYDYTGRYGISGWYNCLLALFITIKHANCLDESIRIICKCMHDYKDPEDLRRFQVSMNQFLVMETVNPNLEDGVIPDNFQTEFNAVCNAVHISKHLVASAKRLRASLFVLDD